MEEIGLRTCKVRRWTGQLEILPNGSITRVTNYSRGQMLALVIIRIAYEEDIDEGHRCFCSRRVRLPTEKWRLFLLYPGWKASLNWPIPPSTSASLPLPCRQNTGLWSASCAAVQKWGLDRAGIEIPYPRRVLYQREKELKTIKEQQKEENKKTDKRVSMAETAGTPECQQQILEEKGGTVL